jgi:branched-chain amino acid transport system permease protein
VLAAFIVGHIVPEYAFWIQSGDFVFIALLGGYTTVVGPLVGAIAFEFIRTYASKYFPNEWQMTLGIIMLAIILFRPGGLSAIYESLVARLGRGRREVRDA